MTTNDNTSYSTGLSEFVDKTIQRWSRQKRKYLEPKFRRNFEAVTNRDNRVKKWKKKEAEGWRSDTWVGFVRVKVWTFYSLLLDTVLKAGKIPFALVPSPYDEEPIDEAGIKERDDRIERMQKKIEDQLAQRKADREYMKKWMSGGYYGMAFSKFNIEVQKCKYFRKVALGDSETLQAMSPEESQGYARYEMAEMEETVPGHKYVSVWDMVWDMEASDFNDFEDCSGYAEIIRSSPYDLRTLKGSAPGYIDRAIDKVISRAKDGTFDGTGQDSSGVNPAVAQVLERKKTIKRYEFYMRVPRRLAEDFEKILKSRHKKDAFSLRLIDDYEDAENSGDDVEVMGEIADKEIIRYIRNETGKRPHKMWVVEQSLDESTGVGIADNMEDVQNTLVGMIRSFEDNKKLSANVTTAIKARYFNNPNQLNDVVPGKKYDIADSCPDVRQAIMPIIYPDVGESLMSGIQLMMQLKDDVSMIPTIMQGFNLQKHKPDTAYEMRQLTENAGKYVGQAIRNNDEMFIEPEIWDIYEYNMLYDDDESLKVNCKIQPNGFTSFQNKEIRGERMKNALSLFVASEILFPHVKIRPHLDIIYESMDEDPERFLKSEEEMNKEAQVKEQMRAKADIEAQLKALKMTKALTEIESQAKRSEEEQKHNNRIIENDQKQEDEIEKLETKYDLEIDMMAAEVVANGNQDANPQTQG